ATSFMPCCKSLRSEQIRGLGTGIANGGCDLASCWRALPVCLHGTSLTAGAGPRHDVAVSGLVSYPTEAAHLLTRLRQRGVRRQTSTSQRRASQDPTRD